MQDIARPLERIGQPAIEAAGFQFDVMLTATRQIEQRGYLPEDVSDIILTHGDPDHIGGLADFPAARVHLAVEEYEQLNAGNTRYSLAQTSHEPRWVTYPKSNDRWFDLESRPIVLSADVEILLIPLFGHTLGHCGVAVSLGKKWLLHVGDAYYLRAELTTDDHPVSALAAIRADNDNLRRASLNELRRLNCNHSSVVEMFGYHDFSEFPES